MVTYKIAQTFYMENLPDYEQVIRQAGLDVEMTKQMCCTEDDIIAFARGTDAIIGAGSGETNCFTRKVMEGLNKCCFVMSFGIGYDSIDVDAATEYGILMANVPDCCQEGVSDHAMALILASVNLR